MSYPPPPPPPPPSGGGFPPPPPPPSGGGFGGGYGGMPMSGGAGGFQYAETGPRIVAGLIDYIAPSILSIIFQTVIRGSAGQLIGGLLGFAGLAFGIYNAYLNGTTGQSVGKKMQGIKVVGMQTGQPIGAGMGIVRWLCHFADACTCYFGYIYGLFIDKDKQTFADKIVKTVVVKA